jgi:hypothetical protein
VELKNVGKCISREMCFSILFIARWFIACATDS